MMNRREFIQGMLLGAGAAMVPAPESFAAAADDRKTASLSLKVTCTTEILKKLSGKNVRLWIPQPRTDAEQEIANLSVRSAVPSRATRDGGGRNSVLFFESGKFKAGDRIAVSYQVKRRAAGIRSDAQEDPAAHLQPSEWEKWDETVASFADQLVGREKDPVRVARKIYDAIIDRTAYVHEACGRGVSNFTFEEKAGRCDEFHALFRSMLMYKGIPAIWEEGILLPYPSALQARKKGSLEADCISAHSWVRFHIGGGQWMPADLSEAKRRPELREYCFGNLTPNRIKMSSGRGIELNPKQDGVMNTFPYPYAEGADGPLIYSHHYRNVMNYELTGMETGKA